MKKALILLVFIASVVVVNAQRGRTYSITAANVDTVENVYFTLGNITGSYNTLTIQALCTNVGGTSDGSVTLEGSLDGTSYTTLVDKTNILTGIPNDTLTITDGAVGQWVVEKAPWTNYRINALGTANDTTTITVKYVYK